MGSEWSKIKKAVEAGDETKALDIYQNNADIQSKLNANAIINEQTLDTFMHLSARHGMIELMKLMLNRNHGNPNKLNRRKQTVLHKICQGSRDSVQHDCLKLLMEWRDLNHSPSFSSSTSTPHKNNNELGGDAMMREYKNAAATDININLKDDLENTPLHYAAMNNLFSCVQVLIANGAYLFVENIEHSTPVDLAEKYGHKEIALFLESKMLFSTEEEEKDNPEELEHEAVLYDDRQNYGLRIQDLQEEKDKLLVETADMLRCNIFTAEILLKKHCWSKVLLLNSWMEDPVKCFEKCGIVASTSPQATDSESEPKLYKISDSTGEMARYSVLLTNSSSSSTDAKLNPNASLAGNWKEGGNGGLRSKQERASMTVRSSTLKDALVSNAARAVSPDHHATKAGAAATVNSSAKARLVHSLKLKRNIQPPPTLPATFMVKPKSSGMKLCNICLTEFDPQRAVRIACGHLFCRPCWQQYLTIKIEEGNVCDIICPQVNCFTIVPHDMVERLITKETSIKYLQFDLKAFVDSNPEIKWCPYPGCVNAVRNPNVYEQPQQQQQSSSKTTMSESTTMTTSSSSTEQTNLLKEYARAVDCGSGHYFCWECLQEGHEPASCKNWKDWFQKVAEIRPEELRNTSEKALESANYLWLVTNSKKCPNPNCNAPIQKNEGCNHVKCYRCKHDFCWICMENWKKHSSLTGGYFQCNRYEVSNKIIQKEKAVIAEAEEFHYKTVELNKFVHYYTRFKNHENSYKIEEPLLDLVKSKFESLVNQNQLPKKSDKSRPAELNVLLNSDDSGSRNSLSYCDDNQGPNVTTSSALPKSCHVQETTQVEYTAEKLDEIVNLDTAGNTVAPDGETAPKEPTGDEKTATDSNNNGNPTIGTGADKPYLFIEEAIRELLKARRILRCSYVYGYYLDTFGHKKFIFEFIQTEFEECTENLSQIIARPHLKTPKHKIVRLTNLLRRKRLEFIDTITRGLNSFNDTPPTLKKYSRQRWKFLLKDNIQNDDEFKNAVAISLRELNPKNPWIVDKKGRHTNLLALLNDWPELEQELDSILVPSKEKNGHCANQMCGNVKAINTLSGSLCNYCSIKCMRFDRNAYLEQKQSKSITTTTTASVDDSSRLSKPAPSSVHSSTQEPSKPHKNPEPGESTKLIKELINIDNNCNYNDQTDYNHQLPPTSQLIDENQEPPLPPPTRPASSSSNHHHHQPQMLPPRTTTTTTTTALLPYNSLFVTSNELDIGIIMKNLESIVYEKNAHHDKTAKVCNFEIKSK